jgi:hypothetical protein
MVIVEKLVEWRLAGETEVLGEKTFPSATSSTTIPTWLDPVLNPGHRGGKPANNRLSYGAAIAQAVSCYEVPHYAAFLPFFTTFVSLFSPCSILTSFIWSPAFSHTDFLMRCIRLVYVWRVICLQIWEGRGSGLYSFEVLWIENMMRKWQDIKRK